MSSTATESVPGTSSPPGNRVLLALLILTPLVSIGLSVLLVLSILHFLARVPSSAVANGTLADPRLLHDLVEPFSQKGTVPVKRFGDVLYYPIPYATPPQLTLTSNATDRSYAIVRQDEFGFVWAVDVGSKEMKDLTGALKDAKDLNDLAGALGGVGGKGLPSSRPGEEFTWEARGMRPFTVEAATPPFQQQSKFTLPEGEAVGVEYFPYPYATAPNLTLTSGPYIKVLATTPTGFKWQKVQGYSNPVQTWHARGIRATPEQVAEFTKNPPVFGGEQLPAIEDSGTFAYTYGEQGFVSFTRPFAAPPNVQVGEVIVTEITPQGFKWKHPAGKSTGLFTARWSARGVPDPTIGKPADNK